MDLKKFLPPVATDFIRKSKKVVKYKSYEEASSHCILNAYQNEELCNMIADKTLNHIKSLNRPFVFNPTTVYFAFALNYFANASSKRSITVLDFGGACGAHYYEIRSIIPQTISLTWIVVETKQMIRSAVSRGFAKGELRFKSRIEDIAESVDFVHSSGTLQYVPAPFDFLQKLINIKAKIILFNRMMYNKKNEDIITVQQSAFSSNGPGKLPEGYEDRPVRYPHTTMSYPKLLSLMKKGGYECFSEFDEVSGKIVLGREDILAKGQLFVNKDFLLCT